jgi:SAM-dependent methyltransferase
LPDDYAQTYDQTFSPFKDYSREALFLRDVIQRCRPHARALLDLACGTATHLLELSRMGFDCIGVDIDPEILEVARRKARDLGLTVKLVIGDMRDFRLAVTVDAAVNMFYSFHNVLYSEAEQLRCLQAIHRALNPHGLLIMELLPEENNLRLYPPGQVFEVCQTPQEDGTVLRVTSENRILDREMKEVIFSYQTLKDDKVIDSERLISPFRRMYLGELEPLLARGGFRILERFGDCDFQVPFTAESRKLVLAAEAVDI